MSDVERVSESIRKIVESENGWDCDDLATAAIAAMIKASEDTV